MEPVPTLHDVLLAQRAIAPFLQPTPLVFSRGVSRLLECEAYLKLETLQPIGAFKVRGGINLVARLGPEERRRGVITASTGNHGQSIAYAARQFVVPCTVAAPEGSNPLKVAAMRDLGAQVVLTGKDFDAARAWVEQEAQAKGLRYVHPANEPLLIAGVGTISLEVMEALHRELRTTFLFSTHDPRVVRHARRVVKIHDGLLLPEEAGPAQVAGEAAHP